MTIRALLARIFQRLLNRDLSLILLIMILIPLKSFAQDVSGRWCAHYRSGSNDGSFEDCVIIQRQASRLEALRWVEIFCSECDTFAGRQLRTLMPLRYGAENPKVLLSKMELKDHGGDLIDENPDPSGNEIVFIKEEKLLIPSFNCAKARQPREQAICSNASLSLLDKELSLVFNAAKACDSTGKLNSQQNIWWRDELSKCQSGECVPDVYSSRIMALRKACK